MKHLVALIAAAIISFPDSWAAPSLLDEIAGLRAAADSLHSIGRTDSAAILGRKAIELADKAEDATAIVGTSAAQGVFLRSLGRIDEALNCYDDALTIVMSGAFGSNPTEEAIEEVATLYINLAVLNIDMQQKTDAVRNAFSAAEWCAKSSDPEFRSTLYGVAGSVLTGCGELEKALHYQDLAYADAVASGNDEAAFRAAAYTMILADRSGLKEQAQAWRDRCLRLMPEITSAMTRLVYYQAECAINLGNGNQRKAIEYFNKILALDGIDQLIFVKYDCYNNMHLSYAELGDYREAYSALLKSNELRDSIWQQQQEERLRDLNVKYETKEKELALAQSEAKRTRALTWLLAALAAILAGIAAFVWYAASQRRRSLEQYIEGMENERRRMAAELHDGVCNDMLAIQMNVKEGISRDSTLSLIETCRESVRRISHELMPPEFAYANIDEVMRYHISKQQAATADRTIAYASQAQGADWADVPESVALEAYRIAQEAIGNALKHSSAENIAVTLTLSGSLLTLAIKDDGSGYASGANRGLGLDSMKRRAFAIGGSVEVQSAPGSGTEITLTVKIH